MHDWRDPLFGGGAPDPTAPGKLEELCETVKSGNHTLGLATDGDADRFSIVDRDGQIISANQIIALLCDYLAETRGWTGKGFARSVATTHLVDRVARAWERQVFETPVGFKFIGALIDEDKIILGGEESAGLSIKNHLPEKDGILACLLVAEMVAARGASVKEQLNALYNRVGKLESGRTDAALSPEISQKLDEKLAREPANIGRRKITKINRLDGVKFLFENDAWLLLRPSGTEPLVRFYAEAETKPEVETLLTAGRDYLLG